MDGTMTSEDLTAFDIRVYEYCKLHDFEAAPWSTPAAAAALAASEDQVYEALCNLQKHMKGNFYLYYRNGALRVQAD